MNAPLSSIPAEPPLRSLHEVMLQAQHSLLISGHTLNKFVTDKQVKSALGQLFERDVKVTLVLLNPHCAYSQAHERFHPMESKGSAREQLLEAIKFLGSVHESFNCPEKFEVYLTSYMPRFRTILVDDTFCEVCLYMYGKDVGVTPSFLIRRETHPTWFEVIAASVTQMLHSQHVIPLIKGGRFHEEWDSSRVATVLGRCLEANCCKGPRSIWEESERILLGDQNGDPGMAAMYRICNSDYRPGTFTIDRISPAAHFIENPEPFDRWLQRVVADEINLLRPHLSAAITAYPEERLPADVRRMLECCPRGQSLKQKIWCQEYSDIIRRVILALVVQNPDHDLDVYPNLTHERRDLILEVVRRLEKRSPSVQDWLRLSVAAGLLGVDEKPAHAATSTVRLDWAISLRPARGERKTLYDRIAKELWEAAKSNCRIDASEFFLATLAASRHGFQLVCFLDDYLEAIVTLKYYEELLRRFQSLRIHCIPRGVRCGNDIAYDDLVRLVKEFPDLQREPRFKMVMSSFNCDTGVF